MIEVVDLFCGLGGFSAGALHVPDVSIMLGVDEAPVPLKTFASNTKSRVLLATLGPEFDPAQLPGASPTVHVHASPPCTDLSLARTSTANVDAGIAMLRWTMDLIITRGDTSWSLENVSTPAVRVVMNEYTTRHPYRVAFATLDAADFGAAQNRIRLIAGPPALIKAIQEMPLARRVCARDAFARRGLSVPTSHVKNQTKSRAGLHCVRSVEEPTFTVCASRECHEVPKHEPLTAS